MKHPPEAVPTRGVLVKAVTHPLRRQILRALHSVEEAQSARELSLSFDHHLANVSYHVRILRDAGALVLTDAIPVRGSMERFYASAVEDVDWLRLLLRDTQRHDQGS